MSMDRNQTMQLLKAVEGLQLSLKHTLSRIEELEATVNTLNTNQCLIYQGQQVLSRMTVFGEDYATAKGNVDNA